jgi:hypothetical protein
MLFLNKIFAFCSGTYHSVVHLKFLQRLPEGWGFETTVFGDVTGYNFGETLISFAVEDGGSWALGTVCIHVPYYKDVKTGRAVYM